MRVQKQWIADFTYFVQMGARLAKPWWDRRGRRAPFVLTGVRHGLATVAVTSCIARDQGVTR